MGSPRIFGTEEHGLAFPPAYTCAPPFGVDIGGTNPAFWAVANSEALGYAQYDSWLTVGVTEGDTANALASIGIAFDAWDAQHPLDSSDDSGGGKTRRHLPFPFCASAANRRGASRAAVFWMDPNRAAESVSLDDGRYAPTASRLRPRKVVSKRNPERLRLVWGA